MGADFSGTGHIPVMLREALKALAVQPGGRYIDCTAGGGGHALAILEQSSPGGQLLGIDADPKALEIARQKLEPFQNSVRLVNDNFVNLQAVAIKYDFFPVHGIIFDLGLSSLQLDGTDRGFSFQKDAPLDMRFSPSQELTASDIVNGYSDPELSQLIRKYGEEMMSRRIAHAIVRERPVRTTLHLARIVERAVGGRKGKIHPATRTFQALRIAVNRELENLESALRQAIDLLGYEGRLVVIAYHSLEDRIVKQLMAREAKGCICPPEIPVCACGHKPRVRLINRKIITPTPEEISFNPRSRSARLRAAERIVVSDDCDDPRAVVDSILAEAKAAAWKKPVLMQKLRMVFTAS
jgi:16S rRNA (cytosine1402-N4)-methyltransferase